MRHRIFRSIFLVALGVLLASLVLIFGAMYRYFSDVYADELRGEAALLASAVEEMGGQELERLDTGAHRVTWIDSDGTVLYDNQADAGAMDNHADRQEVISALHAGVGEAVRYSDTMSRKTVYCAVRLSDGTVLRLAGSQYTAWSLVLDTGHYIVLIIAAALLLGWLLSSRVSRALIQPINAIDLDHPEQADTYEELTPLLDRLCRQKRQLQDQIDILAHKQQEFTTITENMREGLLVIGPGGQVLSYNTSALRLLGASGVTGHPHVFTLNRSEHFRDTVEKALAGEHSETLMPMGSRIYQLMANPVRQDGRVAGAVVMLMDVTEREERDRLRREFTANVSHELKTPLTSISGFAEIMQNGLAREEDMRRFAGNIYQEAQRLITLVGDIIRLSQLDEQTAPRERVEVDLAAAARAVADRMEEAARRQEVTLSCQLSPAPVHGSPQILDEMIFNLCDNAIKYNVPGGSVTLSTAVVDGHPTLTVADTGIGIPYRDQDRVFERFYRVDKSHSREIGGTGLGLSIVKHGAAYHNARVKLSSTPGKGTVVQIVF